MPSRSFEHELPFVSIMPIAGKLMNGYGSLVPLLSCE